VRFWMTGSPWAYAGRALLWDMGTVLTLGLLLPWRIAAVERYKMQNTRYGDLAGDFAATGGAFFRRGWWLWLSALIVPVILVAAPMGGFSLILILAFPVIFAVFRAVQLRWQVDGIRFGPVALRSDLNGGEVFGCYFGMFVSMFGYGAVMAGVIAAVFYGSGGALITLKAGAPWTAATVAYLAALALAYLMLLIGMGAIKRYFLDRGLWKAVAASTGVVNVAALDSVVAKGDTAGPMGEGLADALDFGGF